MNHEGTTLSWPPAAQLMKAATSYCYRGMGPADGAIVELVCPVMPRAPQGSPATLTPLTELTLLSPPMNYHFLINLKVILNRP